MIPVAPQPEPKDFEKIVRKRGKAFLSKCPTPTADQFKKHQYWKDILPELRAAYHEVCAYCSCWIPFDEGSVDHFQPKSVAPAQAYEWSNYRLAQERMNNNKGNSTDVLDPFHIQPDWFILDFASFFVQPNGTLAANIIDAVKKTIGILQLNSETFVKLRYSVLKEYSGGDWSLTFLARKYPFIAYELQRQGKQTSILGTIK